MRTLTMNEVSAVSGGWWLNIAGAIVGGVMTYAERSDDGDMTTADWLAVGGGCLLGAGGGQVLKQAFKKLT